MASSERPLERGESRSEEAVRPQRDKIGAPSTSSMRPSHGLFRQDSRGRTRLFYAAEQGRGEEVEAMLASLPGTGFYPQRLGLIEITDHNGLTAADVAEQNGHKDIAELLRYRAWVMINFG